MITVRREPGLASAPVEVVERKGLGHPDTLADEVVSRAWRTFERSPGTPLAHS